MMDLNKLNPYQKEAVLDESPACLVNANVGSGKTTVLTAKVRYLCEQKGVAPKDLMVLTFTNKAANEIRERLENLTGKEEDLWFGTFHSVALRMLQTILPVEELGYTKEFQVCIPEEEMQKLANSKVSKVPYDAQDNRHTTIQVEGLSAYYHRLLQLGHDPLLGFIFGVADILTGRMTTIDKAGNIVSQVMENYADRKESDIFAALAKQVIHFKSDVTTSMGLPAPLMSLFNLLQFGSIGEDEQTIAEIVQGMYYEGYDFIHFCSMSIPAMLVEVIVRLGYAIKRIKEGHAVKDSIPLSLNREKHPKLATMLFIAHAGATAANAGKVYFTQNPVAINYPQWIAFAKYSYSQLKWVLLEKPALRVAYARGKINEELDAVLTEANATFDRFAERYIIVFN